jgi:hypothetical protein
MPLGRGHVSVVTVPIDLLAEGRACKSLEVHQREEGAQYPLRAEVVEYFPGGPKLVFAGNSLPHSNNNSHLDK